MNLGPVHLRVERSRRVRPERPTRSASFPRHPRHPLTIAAFVVVALVTSVAVSVVPAGAATSDTALGSLSVAVRSVNVTPTSFAIGSCTLDGTPTILQFPNDQCSAGSFTVTNGDAASHIDLKVGSFVPADHGPVWRACGWSPSSSCSGPAGAPGHNQFTWTNGVGQALGGTTAQCEQHASPAVTPCPLTGPSAVNTDQFTMVGPSQSSDLSPSFTIALTWTAVP
jgi:hypothetical protein